MSNLAFHPRWMGGQLPGWVVATTLYWPDLIDRKLEQVESWYGPVVQRHDKIQVQPLTLTLWRKNNNYFEKGHWILSRLDLCNRKLDEV